MKDVEQISTFPSSAGRRRRAEAAPSKEGLEREEPRVLRVEEAARLLAISRAQMYRFLAKGALPVVRIGGCVRVPRAAIDDWIATHQEDWATMNPWDMRTSA